MAHYAPKMREAASEGALCLWIPYTGTEGTATPPEAGVHDRAPLPKTSPPLPPMTPAVQELLRRRYGCTVHGHDVEYGAGISIEWGSSMP